MAFSIGVGLTNECNLRCPHCYRPDMVIERLSRQDLQRVCDSIPVKSMNLGVGENGLHPDYHAILDLLAERGIVTSITSNGLSTEVLTDAELQRFRSVEFSLDFPTEQEHDAFRGQGNWRAVVKALERCANLSLPVTITTVMMRINYDKLPELARVAASFGANLRVNVYQPSKHGAVQRQLRTILAGLYDAPRIDTAGGHDGASAGWGARHRGLWWARMRAVDRSGGTRRQDSSLHLLDTEPLDHRRP
jgi:MoaA/NifB/PqqE/SkfB family radical SAM enzyme